MTIAFILTYHSISSGPPPLRISPRRLDDHLELLSAAGIEILPLAQLLAHDSGAPNARPACSLSFDDGYRDFVDAALPVLRRWQAPSTLFVTTQPDRRHLRGGIDSPLLDLDELAALEHDGVEIGGHSRDHVDLRDLGAEELRRQLGEPRSTLEDHLGHAPRAFAYPFGLWDARVVAETRRHWQWACSTRVATLDTGPDPWTLPRIDAHYLRSPLLRFLLRRGRPRAYLVARRLLRRLRGVDRSAA